MTEHNGETATDEAGMVTMARDALPAAGFAAEGARLAALDSLISALPGIATLDGEERDRITAEALSLVGELDPRDGAEGLLACQMVSSHLAAMNCLTRACRPGEGHAQDTMRAGYLRQAQRFLLLYMQQLKTLDKRRGGPGGARRKTVPDPNFTVRFVSSDGREIDTGRRREGDRDGDAG